MSDLSRLLGDVYHSQLHGDDAVAPPEDETWSAEQVDMLAPVDEEAAPVYSLDDEWSMVQADEQAAEPASPEWADDDTLDEAFADWTPGPDASAPEAEYFTIDDDADQFGMIGEETTVGDAYDDTQYALAEDDDTQYAFADDGQAVETADLFDLDGGDAFADVPVDEAALYDTTDQHGAIDWTTAEPGYPEAEAVDAGPWRRTDDDLLPKSSGGRRRFGRR